MEIDEVANWGREVAISIADHGIGVDPDELEHIFDPFYRGARVMAAQIHGSGLGLAVVRQIMNAIGGKLSVKSQKGQRECLHIVSESYRQGGINYSSKSSGGHSVDMKEKILLIEDDDNLLLR